jgi:hypothetical protein
MPDAAMHESEPGYTPAPPRQPLPPGKQPQGPMPDQDPAQPRGPHHLPDDPVAPEEGALRAYAGLERLALRARVGPW